jgi:hypothetical protein
LAEVRFLVENSTLKEIAQASAHRTEDLVQELARRKLIRPLAKGHLGVVAADRLVYDAQATSGGSGGPVFNSDWKVIGVILRCRLASLVPTSRYQSPTR